MTENIKNWITTKNGVHIPIKDGQSKQDAIKQFSSSDNKPKKYSIIVNEKDFAKIPILIRTDDPEYKKSIENGYTHLDSADTKSDAEKIWNDYLDKFSKESTAKRNEQIKANTKKAKIKEVTDNEGTRYQLIDDKGKLISESKDYFAVLKHKNQLGYDEKPLAFDRYSLGSVRHTDENGFMHVDVSNITKETVNPYYGREIPGWQELHLDPERIYYGYRPLVELEKGAETFNNLPLLSRHQEISAEDPRKDLRVGSLGTDAKIDRPYLTNSLIIEDQKAIDGILNETQKELSCAYRYEPDFTPGEFDGTRYDFVMKNIRGNHVALVHEGRAGSDVVVADENTIKKGVKTMGLKDLFKKTTDGKMAMDEDLEQALEQAIAEKVEEKVAEMKQPDDEGKDPEKPVATDGEETDKNALKNALLEKINTLVKGKGDIDGMSEEDFYKWVNESLDKLSYTDSSDGASDEDPKKVCGDEDPKEEPKDNKPAMDENTIKANMIAHFKAMSEAANEVRPLIGDIDVMAFDSAEDIYGKALLINGYKIKNYDKSAYKGMVAVLKDTKAKNLAMDGSINEKSIEDRFSGLKKIAK